MDNLTLLFLVILSIAILTFGCIYITTPDKNIINTNTVLTNTNNNSTNNSNNDSNNDNNNNDTDEINANIIDTELMKKDEHPAKIECNDINKRTGENYYKINYSYPFTPLKPDYKWVPANYKEYSAFAEMSLIT